MKVVDLDGLNILLANMGREVYAASNACTHEDADLVDGRLEGRSVVCPLHYSEFDPKTDEVGLPRAEKPLPVYKTSTKDGYIYVEL
jgi:nitrite reductase/ring-hydroxylating ferredoxin subunit